MIPLKPFKVASVSSNANAFGLHGHIMVAEDGETWQVGRIRAGGSVSPWDQGQVVEVPLVDDPVRRITRPAWEEVQCEIPQRMPDAPDNVIAEVWGKSFESDVCPPQSDAIPSIVFAADQFKPTDLSSAQEKADFANAFVRLVENNFQEAHFTEPFYHRVSQTFGHIAHFNRETFYRTFFTTALDKLRFMRQSAEHNPVGDPAYTFSDVERLLRAWVIENGVLDKVAKTAEHARNRAEREQLKRLLDKHGPPEDFGDKAD